MKRTITFILALAVIFSLAACGSNTEEAHTGIPAETEAPEAALAAAEPAEAEETSADEGQRHILVAWFSATGHTEPLAKYAAEYLDADLYEIVPAQPYTAEDLNYNDSSTRATVEQNTDDARQEISGMVENMEQYDTIIIAHPIWWGQAPKIIYTFLESYDFSGKTLVTMCTSASSGLGTSAENLQKAAPDSVNWLESKRFEIETDASAVELWLDSIGLSSTDTPGLNADGDELG